jgi:urate oxidase
MATLSANRYGKDLVRVVRVTRNGPVHDIKDVAVRVLLEGGKLETSYYNGDNSWVVPTDTIKNTVYVLAKKHPFTDIEVFGITIARHFLNEYAHYSKAEVTISERPWNRMVIEGTKALAHSLKAPSLATWQRDYANQEINLNLHFAVSLFFNLCRQAP